MNVEASHQISDASGNARKFKMTNVAIAAFRRIFPFWRTGDACSFVEVFFSFVLNF